MTSNCSSAQSTGRPRSFTRHAASPANDRHRQAAHTCRTHTCRAHTSPRPRPCQELPRCTANSPGHATSASGCAACGAWRQGRRRQLDFCRKQLADRCPIISNADTQVIAAEEDLYLIACSLLHELKGLRLAVQDMRDVLKQLCLLPRYPDDDDEIPQLLRRMPSAFGIAGARVRHEQP